MEAALMTVVLGFAASTIGAYLAVVLSLKRFYREKWWERKAEMYSQIVEKLARLNYCYGQLLSDAGGEVELSDEKIRPLNESTGKLWEDLSVAAAAGAFIISDGVASALSDLFREGNQTPYEVDLWSAINQDYIRINRCIEVVRDRARADLMVDPSPLDNFLDQAAQNPSYVARWLRESRAAKSFAALVATDDAGKR